MCLFWHLQLYMSWYITSFFGFTFLNIPYFFKYSCTNIFHRRSLYTFYQKQDISFRDMSLYLVPLIYRRKSYKIPEHFAFTLTVAIVSYLHNIKDMRIWAWKGQRTVDISRDGISWIYTPIGIVVLGIHHWNACSCMLSYHRHSLIMD